LLMEQSRMRLSQSGVIDGDEGVFLLSPKKAEQ